MVAVEPGELVRAVGRMGELVFAHEHGATPWLLVRLDDPSDDLAAALRASGTRTPSVRPTEPFAFQTEVVSLGAIGMRNDGVAPADPEVDGIVRELGDATYHASPIRKRSDLDPAFGERVSVGRATNTDLVLRHPSISKFHAYFQLKAGGTCTLADAASKNGTVVNGKRIHGRTPVEVTSGDRITFGTVWCVVLDARTLWRVIRGR